MKFTRWFGGDTTEYEPDLCAAADKNTEKAYLLN